LGLAALVSLAVALSIAGFGLVELFGRHVERRIGAELDTYLDQISAAVTVGPDGALSMDGRLADPRYEQPLSGLYWQVRDETTGELERSRSLWDTVLELPPDHPPVGATHAHRMAGPRDATLLVHERRIALRTGGVERTLRVVVAIDLAELDAAEREFAGDLVPSLAVLGLTLLIAAWAQIAIGLRPLAALRSAVAAVRRGRAARLSGDFPHEVSPLVEEVNTLLAEREAATERARAQAADLAHGLKTPLTALAADVRRLREAGQAEIASEIEAVGAAMRRHVDRQLARAKAHMGDRGRTRVDVRAVLARLIAVIAKTPAGETRHWDLGPGAAIAAAIDADDLTEILGNLLENAARHARNRVAVEVAARPAAVRIAIDDDGPGIAPDQRGVALRRGGRLDLQGPGAGIGLALAGDLVEMWGGSLELDTAPLGGLRVIVQLPASA
jgi:signal transduction histidine kinase